MRYYKFLVKLKIYNCIQNIVEKKISEEFRLKNINETRNYFLEEIKKNELMSRKHKNVFITLNHFENFLIITFLSLSL